MAEANKAKSHYKDVEQSCQTQHSFSSKWVMKLDNLQNLFYQAIFLEDENSKHQLSQYIQAPQNLNYQESLNI